jgi:hypothetical protein
MAARPTASTVAAALAVTVAVVVAVAMTVGVTWLARPAVEQSPPGAVPKQDPPAWQVEPATTVSPRPYCDKVAHGFAPRAISVAGVTRHASIVTPPRDANGIPGVPPLTEAGKSVFAWDRAQGIRPGDPAGNVLLNAHTWPDGSALGNRLLGGLHLGDRIVVHGAQTRLCYRVTEEVEVLAERGLPRYYTKDGPPQLAILVCSGRRLAPGVWEKRTVWFAAPSV